MTTFDTLKFVRRLERVGVPSEQAEAQAELLTEAFNVNLDQLVSKEYLESRLDARFAEQQAYMDKRFAEQSANFKVLYWMLGLVVLATVTPFLERILIL